MKGDVIVVEENHRDAAGAVVPVLLSLLDTSEKKIVITVAGESGSGKSETATAISEILNSNGIPSLILQQDDYFHLPPKSNHNERLQHIEKVGPDEVNLDLLNSHIHQFHKGSANIQKPLVDYEQNTILQETIDVDGIAALIVEGTYTSLLEGVDRRIFINRDFEQTLQHRVKRNRSSSELDGFISDVLMIEHKIIAAHRERADIIINDDFSVDTKL